MNYVEIILAVIVAVFISLIFMPLAIKISHQLEAVDRPGERKLHERDTPILGGLVIVISFFVSCLFFLSLNRELLAFFAGLIVITLTGLIDDLKHIDHYLKFTGEISASLIFIIFSGAVIVSFGDLIGTGAIATGILAIPISVFCMVGVMNALNMADGLDGLAAGNSAIACIFLGYFAFTSGQLIYLYVLLKSCHLHNIHTHKNDNCK